MSDYLVDEFLTTQAGRPFRLFPFGRITKNGVVRELTREIAAKFRIPHYKPAIKLGSHKEETPAAGHIIGLEVREDGLYALPEWNESGMAALSSGSYRYHSPEIIWDGAMEDSANGRMIEAPLIVGDALLHNPALGEAAALYSVEITNGGNDMVQDTMTVPVSWFERLLGRAQQEPEPAPEPANTAQNFEAQIAEFETRITQYEARIAEYEAAQQRQARVDTYTAQLAETAVAGDVELVDLLVGLPDETAGEIVRRFKALSAQINTSLMQDIGHEGELDPGDPVQAFDAAIRARMAEESVDYLTALSWVKANKPELYRAYGGA